MIVAAVASLVAAGCCKNCECGKPDCKCGCKDGKECVCAKAGEAAKTAAAAVKQAKDAVPAQAKDVKKQAK